IRELLNTRQLLLVREQSLQESEAKFRTLFELYPVATVLIDHQTGLAEDFNHAALEQLGYSAQEFAGLHIADYEAQEGPEDIRKHIEHILHTGRDDFTTRHRCKDDSILDVQVTVIVFEVGSKSCFLSLFRNITDHLSTIRALEESEQRFRDVAEAAGEYIWEIDTHGVYTFLTPRAEDLFGHPVEDILGRSPFDFMPREEAERVEKLLAGWAARGVSWQGLEHQTIRADGKLVWQLVSGMPILDFQGNLKGFRGTGLDITAEKEARHEQQELANRLRLATEAANLGIWDLRLSDNYLEWDEGMFRIYGLSRKDFQNSVHTWLDALLPEYRDQAPQDLQQGIASGQPYESEFKIHRGDGTVRHIRAIAQPIHDDQGHPVRVVGINEDVTQGKRAEERLYEQERLYRGLVESQQDLIVRVDNEGCFTYVNDAYCRKFGKSRDELIGSSFQPMLHEDDIQATRQAMHNLEHPPYRAYIEHRAQTQDGWRWLSWEDSAVVDDYGNILEIQGVGRDITDLKEAQRKAETASRSKSEFLANMSHEIRTPMNAVIGLAQLLLQTSLNEKQRDYLNKINTSSRMLLEIINDILDYSKIEAGKLELDAHPFRMDALLDQMKTLFGSAAGDKGLDIFFRISPQVPNTLIGDSLRLGQIFTNLLGNAIKFTNKGHTELVVQVAEGSDQKGQESDSNGQETVRLRFEVRDTGIGMDEEQISRLFQAFSQADTSTTRKYGGTGLGLVISQKLVDHMGGQLHVQSTSGQGSRFFFALDLPVAEEDLEDRVCREVEGHRVLIVDDHPTARLVLREILEGCTFQVTEAEDGRSAVEAVLAADRTGAPFDYIFMDWKMPGELDGFEAVKELEKLHNEGHLSQANPPVGIVSVYSRDELPDNDSACFHCFLTKPVTASSVFDALAESRGRAPEHQSDTSKTAIPSFAGYSILVAEDNILNQEVAEQILQKTGARVTVAHNGAEALETVRNKHFDVVLMDLQMPVMDGFEATRNILKRFPDLPVIALSAAVMEADQKQAREAGMQAHLAKPIDSRELYRTLARWLPVQDSFPQETDEQPREDPVLPDSLEGFDLNQGLKSADGDKHFYLKMLHRFDHQLDSEFAGLEGQLDPDPDGSGPRKVHTLKGMAGTVGAVRLAEVATSIDHALKQDQAISRSTVQELRQAMEAAKIQLATLPSTREQVPETDPAQGRAAMAELLQLLQANEMVDEDVLTTAVHYIQRRLDGQRSAQLAQLVNNFEHEAAAGMLLQIGDEIGEDIQ
ncbi:MAG: PAS domain S-box protein, partial [Desulfovermiculus sp.]